jgi:hypothetical protein
MSSMKCLFQLFVEQYTVEIDLAIEQLNKLKVSLLEERTEDERRNIDQCVKRL